ncbi:hypothetical protein ACFV0L_10580 [Streptosporangium canum]|uniref:hypothetical protein n=1 Tax=Streptosporangium canum TaxID=324952 RepID=UPI0036BC2E04
MADFDPSEYWGESVKAARIVAKSYMKFEVEDIAQAICLDMVEHPQRYRSIRGNLFFEALKKAGYRYCQDQASRNLRTYDEYTYSADEIIELLYRFYDPVNWPNGWSEPSWESYEGSLEEFGLELELWAENTRICIDMFDIQNALGKLSAPFRRVVDKRHRENLKLSDAERSIYSRAIRLVTYYVNEKVNQYRNVPWDYEGPGARRTLSNAQAQNLTSTEY